MVNLKEKKLILLYEYLGHGDVCCDCCKEILELIEAADAIIDTGDLVFIDMEAFDCFMLSHLKDLQKEAEKENTYAKAYDYVCAADNYLDDRRRYIDQLTLRYADHCPNKRLSYRQSFEFAYTNYSALFGHFIHAHALLFRSIPTPADLNSPEDSNKKNPDSE